MRQKYTKKSIINDIIGYRIENLLLCGFWMIDLIKGKELRFVFDFDRNLLLIIREVILESIEIEFILIKGPHSDEYFETGIMVMGLSFFR